MNTYDVAVIFAGGKSRRMGEDKALLPFDKHPSLSSYQYHKLKAYFQKVYISAKENKFDFDCTVIKDIQEVSSPLVALLSIFETPHTDELFVLSVDAPFVDEKIIHTLMREELQEFDCIVAKSPSGIQPLCARYKRSIVPLLKQQYAQGNHKLHDLLKKASTHIVVFDDDTPFSNLNHPEEYQEALKRLVHR